MATQTYSLPGAQTPNRAYAPGLIAGAQQRKKPKPRPKQKRKVP